MSMLVRTLMAAVFVLGLCSGCGESDALVRRKLEVILSDDLASVIAEVPPSSVADSAYYVVREYRPFDEGVFSVLAVAELHFLKGDIAQVVRKYRYHRRFGQWERYYNVYEYSSGGDSGSARDRP